MNQDIEALRAAMRAAQVSGKGQYIEEGRHVLEVKLGKCQRTQMEGRFKETYLIEFTVISSTNPTHEVGSTRTYAENPENAGWMGRFKACLAALAGFDPDKPLPPGAEDQIADVIAALRYDEFRIAQKFPENFLKGLRVTCEGMPGKSRGEGTAITHKKWGVYVEPTAPAPVSP